MHGSLAEYYNQSGVKYHAGWQLGPWGVTMSLFGFIIHIAMGGSSLCFTVFCTAFFRLIYSQIIINVQYAWHQRPILHMT